MTDEEALLALEHTRCAAIGAADAETLKEILSDDYVHVHATGKIDDRAGYIDAIVRNPRTSERRNLTVRVFGDAAVLIGEQVNRTASKTTNAVVQQMAIRRDGRWRFVSMQMTLKA